MITAKKGNVRLPKNLSTKQKISIFNNIRQGGLIGVFLIFVALLTVIGCNKVDMKSNTSTIYVKQNIIYKGVTYPMEGTYDTVTKQMTYNNKPEALLDFGKDTNVSTVTHAIIYEDRTDIYLYDDTIEFNNNVKFENGNQNRLKSMNGARCKTYDGLATQGNAAWNFGANFRTITNPNYGNLFFGSVWGYGFSVPWVGNWENDAISSLTLEDLNSSWIGTEKVHFQGCQHINWGGSKLLITLVSAPNHKIGIAPVGTYPFKLWGWLPWGTWDNKISSYEIVQANVSVGGHLI